MNIRTDIVKMYKEVHGWVGIISGLALFIAFYAGAITMFEAALQRWASPPPALTSASLEKAPILIEQVLAAYPEAAKSYDVHVALGPDRPARLSWSTGGGGHGSQVTHYASLEADGSLRVTDQGASQVAELIDILHQQVGLPFDHEIAMPIMGAIALLYGMALISGTIVLLPSLVKDLFAVRVGKNVKRMWLDTHNVLGLFSLPFHIVMALSAVVFAFHDQFYDAQALASPPVAERRPETPKQPDPRPVLPPVEIIARLAEQAPDFAPITLSYQDGPRGQSIRVQGRDTRYPMRGADFGIAVLDPHNGDITSADYMPGKQSAAFAVLSSFFALHFGNYGGAPVRWGYFLLGLGGAALFYTGNLLWVESRRKRERKAGAVTQSRPTRILAGLTVGVSLGCVAGISITLASAKLLPAIGVWPDTWHSPIYYAVFLAMVAWALWRGGARTGGELLAASAVAYLAIPAASLLSLVGIGWHHGGSGLLVDIAALCGAGAAAIMARRAFARSRDLPSDSVWHAGATLHTARKPDPRQHGERHDNSHASHPAGRPCRQHRPYGRGGTGVGRGSKPR